MSNKTRLQTNNENLQSLIDKANVLPDVGGSENVETCTVTINILDGRAQNCFCCATRFINGSFTTHPNSLSTFPATITNVVCGSGLSLRSYRAVEMECQGLEEQDCYISTDYSNYSFKVDALAGATASINVSSL